jgi:hypothetical protein
MTNDTAANANTSRPYGSYVRPVLKALAVLAFLVFVVPTAIGFVILYRREHALTHAFPGDKGAKVRDTTSVVVPR